MRSDKSGIGLFGGTFDPIHLGHLIVAEWLSEVLQVKRTFFIPTKIHPFNKRVNISAEKIRLEMLDLALKDYPRFEISKYELENESISYAVDTIKFFQQKNPDEKLYYFIGRDNLDAFLEWKDPMEILKMCYLVVYNRGRGYEKNDLLDHSKVISVDSPLIEISSSHVRKRIKQKMPFKSLVPHQVFDYIIQKKLYQS